MKNTIVRTVAIAAVSLAAVAAHANIDTYHAHGSVVAVDAASQQVTVKQDAVTELGWPARTVTYSADGSNVLKGIAAGNTVDVVFTATNPYQASAHFVTPVSK